MSPAQQTYLDVLRVVAAQMVLVGHILSLTIWTTTKTGLGDLGVIVFFVLSGFLISYTSVAKKTGKKINFKSYFLDRFVRIFTPFVPALVLVAVLDWVVISFTESTEYSAYYSVKNFLANLLMLQQHPVGMVADQIGFSEAKLSTFGSARPFWTVANEWWLYLAFGMLLFPTVWKRPVVASLAFGLIAVVPLFNMVAGTGQSLSFLWAVMAVAGFCYYGNEAQISYLLQKYSTSVFWKFSVAVTLAVLLFLLLVRFLWISFVEAGFQFNGPVFYDLNFYLILAILLSVVFLLLQNSETKNRNGISRFLADYSYSLYLVHYSLIYCVASLGWLPNNASAKFAFLFVFCNFFAIGMWWLFERNYREVKDLLSERVFKKGAVQ